PRGAWHIYSINMLGGNNSTDGADYTQFAFGPDGFYFSGNMFDQAGVAYQGAKYCGSGKAQAEAGAGINIFCLFGPSANGVILDTLQPVMNEVPGYGPRGEIFVNTFNINGDPFGDDCFFFFCHWAVVWVMSNVGPWASNPGTHSGPIVTGTYLTNIRD